MRRRAKGWECLLVLSSIVAAYIGVIGASDATAAQLGMAREVGGLLAGSGAVLICGGLGGVMEAACSGAQERGGTTVGLLPGRDRSNANRFLTVALSTGLGELRNGLIIRSVDAVIAIGAGWGTLSEIALALRTDVPLFVLGSWGAVRDANGREVELGHVVATPEEAVRQALESVPGEGRSRSVDPA